MLPRFLFKGFLIRSDFWLKLLSLGKASGLTIFPFIFVGKQIKNKAQLLNHERIHIRQQIETLFIIFFILYFIEYFFHRFTKSSFEAYKAISFEQEAYCNDHNLNYLNNRKPYSFIKYYKK